MNREIAKTMAREYFVLVSLLGAAWQMQEQDAKAQDTKSPYPSMAPALEPGGMSYMMSKKPYLTDGSTNDDGSHDMAHVMFYTALVKPTDGGRICPNLSFIRIPNSTANQSP